MAVYSCFWLHLLYMPRSIHIMYQQKGTTIQKDHSDIRLEQFKKRWKWLVNINQIQLKYC